jgi:hypothetical protein
VRSVPLHSNSARESRLDRTAPTQPLPFSTKGRVPVATTILLFTIVGALIAFIAIAG